MANSSLGLTQDVTVHDTNTTKYEFSWLMVTTTAGAVKIGFESGDTVTLAAVPVGVWIPTGNANQVFDTGTTAVGIMVV